LDEKLASALIGLAGVVVGLVGRDFVMAPILVRWKRTQEIQDKKEAQEITRHELVRVYADPLLMSIRHLKQRLDEIAKAGQARYLLANAPNTEYVAYKRISTIYRLPALLGWIRAFRREHSYLDPHQQVDPDPTELCINEIMSALADGQHVEEQRLGELMHLWRVSDSILTSETIRRHMASEIDGIRQELLEEQLVLDVSDLSPDRRKVLAERCAESLRSLAQVDLPQQLIDATVDQALAVMGIKEAYIYRDWQSAIGDMMNSQVAAGPRRFEVIGFGEFEDRYLRSKNMEEGQFDRRWFARLQTLFHDLDMSKTGIFDARREQIKRLNQGLLELEAHLAQKRAELTQI
jgi:hypothetical protein